ncbi:hypothetical protein PAXINDRAFT_20608 [Paxillus involutus ATCC 200175]|uniref:Uncharacterized protein n=1 Tax=Paxillus involutus ATCC 200175 TaxID=664439 RepID=A0A0C9TG19_PAXIN|nr:hypothetical protein PAXINDRAFT_20608 [Paxillus involutus ATCC 200175]
MDLATLTCTESASRLGVLLTELSSNPKEESWVTVERIAQHLANSLRVRNASEDNHTILGGTSLPQDITALLSKALEGSPIPDDARAPAVFEVLRVSANLCVDHDQNRGQLLEAGFPQAVVSLLEGYADNVPPEPQVDPLPLSISHLQVIKTAIGVLLNSSLGYEPVKFRLTSLEVATTLVRLSSAIYPAGAWMRSTTSLFPAGFSELDSVPERVAESWTIRTGLSSWAWRLITELRDDAHPLFDTNVLPYLIQPLIAFTPPLLTAPPPPNFARPSHLRTSLLHADFDLLSESCSHLESLALDVDDIRLSLARGFTFPAEHQNVPCLSAMLNFIEQGNYAPLWYVRHETSLDDNEVKSQEKAFDDCKAAVIKAVVEVSGEEKNVDVLCDDSEEMYPGGQFVSRMVNWIRSFVTAGSYANVRDDMVICATLALGNLTRRDYHATLLLSPPHNIAQLLSSETLLSPSTDIKLKHGVIGLLKRLSQSSVHSSLNRSALGNARVIERIIASGVWDDRSDVMADIVQVNAIGVVKHLCNNSIDNSFLLVLPSDGENNASTGLAQLHGLVKRSDTVAIKSEGTRVIVNLVKSLWSNDPTSEQRSAEENQATQQKRERAIQTLVTGPYAEALAALVGRSPKYPMLINEAVVALSLLSTHRDGVSQVLSAIVAPLPVEISAAVPGSAAMSTVASTGSETGSPMITSSPAPRGRPPQKRAVDHLLTVLRNNGSDGTSSPRRGDLPSYPVELRTNICALLGQVGKRASGEDLEVVKEATRSTLEDLARISSNAGKDMLGIAAKRVLEVWSSA